MYNIYQYVGCYIHFNEYMVSLNFSCSACHYKIQHKMFRESRASTEDDVIPLFIRVWQHSMI